MLNRPQRVVIILTALVVAGMCLCPPWKLDWRFIGTDGHIYPGGVVHFYAPISAWTDRWQGAVRNHTPQHPGYVTRLVDKGEVVLPLLALQCVGVLVVGAAAFILSSSRAKGASR
jgi:hypothetical protein